MSVAKHYLQLAQSNAEHALAAQLGSAAAQAVHVAVKPNGELDEADFEQRGYEERHFRLSPPPESGEAGAGDAWPAVGAGTRSLAD